MQIELSPSELRFIKIATARQKQELQDELVHTDDRAYRADLRHTLEELEALDRRVGALIDAL